ncbi:MAG TPA: glycosyltransferase family 4 protein [Pyrinomonadaceae bacterium]|nr:glycosyltransferase family 4 protein [Pyrinomonadaceae bacterium]
MKEKHDARSKKRGAQTKVVLLVLSGEAKWMRQALMERYEHASIEELPRALIESGGMARRLEALRALRPDIFVVATERLAWQRGQNAFLLFGALAGARRTVIMDAHKGWREEGRGRSLFVAPARLAREASVSAQALLRAARRLRRLELAVRRKEHLRARPLETSSDERGAEIVYVRATPGPGTQLGGAASHINGFINAALKLGARISLLSNDQIAGLDENRAPLKIIWPRPIGSTRAAFDIYNNLLFTHEAAREIEEQRPDFIYQRYSRFTWAGVEASLRSGRPLFLEYNGSEVWVGRYWDRVGSLGLLERYERLNLRAAARVFVVSEVERQNLLAAGVEDEKIVVNPNGVDAEHFRPGIGGEQVRRELGIERDETLVGFVGTFGPWHGVVALAEAIKLMPESARVRFLMVGSGVLRGEVERILHEANAEDRVILTGAVEHGRVPALLDACDVLASPHVPLEDGSAFFGSPTKLFEYMAMGRGIVASRLGQIGDVLEDEETALLVKPGDAQELSRAILRLVESPDLRERLGRAARREAIARHTWTHNAQRVLDAYHAWGKTTTETQRLREELRK